ncbi:MAG: methenyltetrahydromethanopterin cyclohydrolase [Candidatus Bipolaricaulota bacterium]
MTSRGMSCPDRCRWLLDELVGRAADLGVELHRLRCGALVADAGVNAAGSYEAGRLLIELSHVGLCSAAVDLVDIRGTTLTRVTVESLRPTVSTYYGQASFPLPELSPDLRLCGPLRVRTEQDSPLRALEEGRKFPSVGIVEWNRLPDDGTAQTIALRAGVDPSDLVLVASSVRSVVGATQIAGRINECVIFTIERSLGLDSTSVLQIVGQAPICPSPGGWTGALWPDDLIHYLGRAYLTVDDGVEVHELAEQLCFATTPIYGRLFGEVLAEAGGVFERIPDLVHINKPAVVTAVGLRSGRMATAGHIREDIIHRALRDDQGTDAR